MIDLFYFLLYIHVECFVVLVQVMWSSSMTVHNVVRACVRVNVCVIKAASGVKDIVSCEYSWVKLSSHPAGLCSADRYKVVPKTIAFCLCSYFSQIS